MQNTQHDDQDYIPELLALMPLSARDVLICNGGSLARAYRRRNPLVHLTALGNCDPDDVDGVLDPEGLANDPDGLFDLVVLNGTAEGSKDPVLLFDQLAARLKPGGQLVASFENDAHWSRMCDRLAGQPVTPAAMQQEQIPALMKGCGLVLQRVRGRRLPVSDRQCFDGLMRVGIESGTDLNQLELRLLTTHFVAVATRPFPAESIAPPVRFHLSELAVGMDVRTRIPAEALSAEPAIQVSHSVKDLTVPDFGTAGGIVLLQRPRVSDPRRILDYVAECQRKGIIVVIEYDDDPSLVARVLPRVDVPHIYARNMALAHAVQTSTPVLAQQFGRWNPEVRVFPNGAEDLAPIRQHEPGPLRVLYGGLNRTGSDQLAALMAPAIEAVPDLQMDVIHDRVFFDALPGEGKRFREFLPYRDYLDLLGQCDILLMPLEGLPDELGKSDVKWVEASSRGVVAVASPAVYEATIRHGENGFIVRKPEDWSNLLIELAADPALRTRVASTAWEEVRQGRMMAQQVAHRRDWYLDLMSRRDELFANAIRRSPALAAALAGS
ncbi:glycosyltransferase [Paracoccus albus]|uniref:glycosyltransferase n=1 Tax=Paracoccus albus TaxID=3017784 RepID=UPI0022F0562E|nr:glycosyltransferase [Paracoccus albus]WBU59098.1 glycosyltransferase [Paracoccus albus]